MTSLRRFLPKIYKEELKKIVTFFADSKVALLCDETSDSLNRSVFQIILIKLDLNYDNRPKLVDTLFLEAVNFETVSRSIIDCLVKMNIKFQNVMAFISDNASYMTKAFKFCLKTILFNATHVTCFAYIITLVGETWRSNLSEIDGIVANLKSIFARGSNRKRRFIDLLKQNQIENPVMYPSPVVTRWKTWFKALKYINQHFQLIKDFVDSECDLEETIALSKLQKLFKTNNLKEQFEFVATRCDKFIFTLLKFENQNIITCEVYSIISDLYFWIVGQLDSHQKKKMIKKFLLLHCLKMQN